MAIHTYGAYFGLTVSFIIGKAVKPRSKPETGYNSNIFAMIGAMFLWMYWPSFNAGYFASTPYEKSLVITNTIISLTGSCLASFAISALLRKKFNMEDILNASLAGGVIIGAPSGVLYNPAASLVIGFLGGCISVFGFNFLTEKL
jgi:ammonium transporter Rh